MFFCFLRCLMLKFSKGRTWFSGFDIYIHIPSGTCIYILCVCSWLIMFFLDFIWRRWCFAQCKDLILGFPKRVWKCSGHENFWRYGSLKHQYISIENAQKRPRTGHNRSLRVLLIVLFIYMPVPLLTTCIERYGTVEVRYRFRPGCISGSKNR